MLLRTMVMVLLLALLACGCVSTRMNRNVRADVSSIQQWLCYYGKDRAALDAADYEMFILDRGNFGELVKSDKAGRIFLGYISAGEAEDYRPYWDTIKSADWVLEENKNWPGARLVDTGAPEWYEEVVGPLAADITSAGYDGYFLDTLDSIETLKTVAPEKYEGACDGLVALIRRLRETHPDAVIVVNRGFTILPRIVAYIDGVLIEGVRSSYNFSEKRSRLLTESDQKWMDSQLAMIKELKRPIFALDYMDPPNAAESEQVFKELIALGTNPLISTVDLMHYMPPDVWRESGGE